MRNELFLELEFGILHYICVCQLKSAPDGLSVTEMEIRQFQAVFPDSAQSRMFFYFRSPQVLRYGLTFYPSTFRASGLDHDLEND